MREGVSNTVPVKDTLYYAALLAGLGAESREIASGLASSLSGVEKENRTCIDSGSEVMFPLCAPGRRCLRVITHRYSGDGGRACWLRSCYKPGRTLENWHTETYRNEHPAAWERACEMTGNIDRMKALRQVHAILGPQGRIYSVDWQMGQDTPQVWVNWQLDRTLRPDKALRHLRCDTGWEQAARQWELLLGVAPRPDLGPWSIGVLLNDVSRLRLGSTNWARCTEGSSKRRRLAALVESWGGDRRFAEVLYKLCEASARPGRPNIIGRAVEIEFINGYAKKMEFFICIP